MNRPRREPEVFTFALGLLDVVNPLPGTGGICRYVAGDDDPFFVKVAEEFDVKLRVEVELGSDVVPQRVGDLFYLAAGDYTDSIVVR